MQKSHHKKNENKYWDGNVVYAELQSRKNVCRYSTEGEAIWVKSFDREMTHDLSAQLLKHFKMMNMIRMRMRWMMRMVRLIMLIGRWSTTCLHSSLNLEGNPKIFQALNEALARLCSNSQYSRFPRLVTGRPTQIIDRFPCELNWKILWIEKILWSGNSSGEIIFSLLGFLWPPSSFSDWRPGQ